MIRLVLFDIDGTLIASGGAGLHAFAAVARSSFGAPDGMEKVSFAGRTDVSIVREFFVSRGIPATDANIARFLDDYVFWLDYFLEQRIGRVLPGVEAALASLAALPEPPVIGLLTGNIRLGAELKLRRYGLWSRFALGAFSDDHEDRGQIAVIARDRGNAWVGRSLCGEEVLVIGDTPHDIACARVIGAPCLAVATGGTPLEALRAHAPAYAVARLDDVDIAGLCANT